MNEFKCLQSLCGLSNREAAEYLDVAERTVENWRAGKNQYSNRIIVELCDLWSKIKKGQLDIDQTGPKKQFIGLKVYKKYKKNHDIL